MAFTPKFVRKIVADIMDRTVGGIKVRIVASIAFYSTVGFITGVIVSWLLL